MKYNWPAVVKEFRAIVLENVKLYAVHGDPKVDPGLMEYFRMEMQQTDTFHPWDNDGQLSRALEKMPTSCNYRSCKSYWARKDGKESIGDALYEVLSEIGDSITYHFEDKWNFAPGFKLPEDVVMPDWDRIITDKIVNRIIKAAKK